MSSSSKSLCLASLAAAASLAPAALAATPASGSLASLTLTVRQYTGDTLTGGLVATSSVDLTGVTSTAYADGAGRVRQAVDGLGKVSTASYDANGNLVNRTDATGAGTAYTYDNLNRKLAETDLAIAGKVRSYAYDLVGHLLSATDPLGIVTSYAYDLRDRKISDSTPMNGSQNRVIRYGYNNRGQMTTLTDANGSVTTWGFDSAGRQTSKLYANGDARSMAYDAAGRLVTLTDENGFATTSVFDLAGRLLTKVFSADNSTDTFAYDAASRMIAVTKGRYNHTLNYGYDSAGRFATETHPDGEIVNLAYDNANRVANISLSGTPVNYAVAYGYDARGQMASVSTGDYSSNYAYRDNGQLASTVDFQIINSQSDILRADRSYDSGARLTQVANTAINGDQAGVVYTLGADDQRLTATEETGQRWNYGYDGLKQLVSAQKTDTAAAVVPPLAQAYGYDTMGNRNTYKEQGTSVAYTTNVANQYTSVVATGALLLTQSQSYDKNGNMLTDGIRNYTWDAENQLTSVTPINPVVGSQQVQYSYDWRGRRTSKISFVYTTGGWGVVNTSNFKYAEWNPIEEKVVNVSTSDVTTKNYVWGNDLSGNMNGAGGVGGLLSQRLFTPGVTVPAVYFYGYDGNGNVRALIKANPANPATSAITARYAYDGFGKEVAVSGVDADKNAFRFSTKALDAETGMNYYGYRYYTADAGRWINRDPIKEKGGVNLYAMTGNDVIDKFDINGLVDWRNHATRKLRDLGQLGTAGQTGTNYPGGPTYTIDESILANAAATWSLVVKCKCTVVNNARKFLINYIQVDFTPVVHYRESYPTTAMATWVDTAEQDHVGDYNWWARNEGKPLVAAYETSNLNTQFNDNATCVSTLTSGVTGELQASFQTIVDRTIASWDTSLKHLYNGN